MTRRIPQFLILAMLLFFSTRSVAQFSLDSIKLLDKEKPITEKRVDSILSTIKPRSEQFAKIAHNFSFFFYSVKKEYDLAIKYGKIEVSILDSLNLINSAHTNAYYNIGKFYTKKRMFRKASNYYKMAVKSNKLPVKVGQSLCKLGECYFKLGDFHESTNHYIKGLSLLEKHAPKLTLIKQSIRFSFNCNEMSTKKSSVLGITCLKRTDSMIKNTPNIKVRKTLYQDLLLSLGNLYSIEHNYNFEKANFYYRKVLDDVTPKKDSAKISNTCLNIGELYLKKNLDSAFLFLTKSLKYDRRKFNIDETYRNISKYYTLKKDYPSALKSIKTALNYNVKIRSNKELNNLSSLKLLGIEYKKTCIKALKAKSEILLNLYLQTKDTDYLHQVIENVEASSRFVSTIVNYSNENNTKFLWREEVSDNFSLGAYAAFLLKSPNLMFDFMEANKAFLLTYEIDRRKQQLNLPTQIRFKNTQLKRRILELEEKVKKDFSLRDSLFNVKSVFQNFKDSIQNIYPEYLSLDQNIKPVTLEKVKKDLDHNDVVISFSLNNIKIGDEKSRLIGLAITKDKAIPFKIPDSNKTIESLNLYRKLLSTPLKTKEDLDEFKSVAYFLYDQLFPTPEIKELINNKNILIVPDVSMENTPLEALISEKDSLHYLVEDCNISYAYSLTFSELNKDVIRKTSNDISFYSPIKFDNTTIPSLPFTEKESDDIENIISGNFLQLDNANKSNFLKNSSNSKIIHLATHADASGNPQIQFYDSILPLHELYTYKNNADLVVLSACETNLGEIKKGEGVLSLARGFFHSGANSVISSLWKINDASTSEIMTDFYKNLKDNQSKTFALNNAKRSYLKNHSLSEKSPYYWASFVLIGDTNPVFESNLTLYLSILLIAVVTLFIFFFKKRG